jgi:hypothetical protein
VNCFLTHSNNIHVIAVEVSGAKISNLLNNMLSSRLFEMFLQNQSSRWR